MSTATTIQLLGPLRVLRAGVPVAIDDAEQTRLLTLLALRVGIIVGVGELADAVWPDAPPCDLAAAVGQQVHRLRSLLGTGLIVHRASGYVLDVAPEAVDSVRFEALVRMGEPYAALALWRGDALADTRDEAFAQPAVVQLEELHALAVLALQHSRPARRRRAPGHGRSRGRSGCTSIRTR